MVGILLAAKVHMAELCASIFSHLGIGFHAIQAFAPGVLWKSRKKQHSQQGIKEGRSQVVRGLPRANSDGNILDKRKLLGHALEAVGDPMDPLPFFFEILESQLKQGCSPLFRRQEPIHCASLCAIDRKG